MPKRSPDEILRDIERSEIDDAADEVLSMSREERRKALEAAGADLPAMQAKADEWHHRIERAVIDERKEKIEAAARARLLRPPSHPRRWFVLAAAIAVAAIVLGLLFFPRLMQKQPPIAVPSAWPIPSTSVGTSAIIPSTVPEPSAPRFSPMPEEKPPKPSPGRGTKDAP
jgi:hypothetical protein